MKFIPHDYQKYAIEYIKNNPIAAVLLDMGLGKTVITLTAINDLLNDSFEVSKILIIAPLRVAKTTWSDEIRKWEHLHFLRYSVAVGTEKERLDALHTPADIYIINRENVQWLIEKSGVPFDFDMVVIDELSSFKNHQSKRFRSLMSEGQAGGWSDRNADRGRTDGFVGAVPAAGYGTAVGKIHREIPGSLLPSRQDERADRVLLQAASRRGEPDI